MEALKVTVTLGKNRLRMSSLAVTRLAGFIALGIVLLGAVSVKAQLPGHTRSIVACDLTIGACGIAVVSFTTGTPAFVPLGQPGIVVATQGSPSIDVAQNVIALIEDGNSPQEALNKALAADPGQALRQFGVAAIVNVNGNEEIQVATSTGVLAFPHTCFVTGTTYSVQANIQSTPAVCQAMAEGFEAASGSFPLRLLAALKAGTPVGNDLRGEFSASIRVFDDDWALREGTTISAEANVDRNKQWEEELKFSLIAYMANSNAPQPEDLVPLTRRLAKRVLFALKRLGYYKGSLSGIWNDKAEEALVAFQMFNLLYTLSFGPKMTVLIDGVRHIDGVLADYIILGQKRRVLLPACNSDCVGKILPGLAECGGDPMCIDALLDEINRCIAGCR